MDVLSNVEHLVNLLVKIKEVYGLQVLEDILKDRIVGWQQSIIKSNFIYVKIFDKQLAARVIGK